MHSNDSHRIEHINSAEKHLQTETLYEKRSRSLLSDMHCGGGPLYSAEQLNEKA